MPETQPDSGPRYRSKIFTRGAWFLGPAPELTQRQWRVLGLMVVASFFSAYDVTILSFALPQIQAGLKIDEENLGYLASVIRLGVVPGFLFLLVADRVGRRRLLLLTIVGYTIFTGATAFALDAATFVVFQFFSLMFVSAERTLATVVVAEEIEAEWRGWAIGVLGALSALGGGVALLLFAFVDVLPMGWRALYLLGVVPLVIMAYLRRNLPETERFERYRATRSPLPSLSGLLTPLGSLVRMYPHRFVAVGAVIFLMSLSGQPAGFFFPKYMLEVHGWEPWQFSALGAVIGFLGICATPFFGRLGDQLGRKPVSIFFIIVNPLSVIALYSGTWPFILPLLFLGMRLSDVGSDTNLSTFTQELFPTSYRSTAAGAWSLVGQLGGSAGLALESLLLGTLATHWSSISALALLGLAVPFIVALAYPETSRRQLEEISPER
jgi:putative MFS transporter